MSVVRKMVPQRQPRVAVIDEIFCDVCGSPAMSVRRLVATLSRVQDDGRGNMETWDLDLCEACKNAVMNVLQGIARINRREIPRTRQDYTRPEEEE